MGKLGRRLVVAMLLGVAIYGALVLYRGTAAIRGALEGYAFWTFAAACGLASCNYLLRFLKWEFYLARLGIRGIPKGESLLTFLSGFVLTVTPGKVGEVFKSVILQELRGVPVSRSAPIVVAERVTDLIGVIALITIGSLAFSGGLVWASLGAALVALLLAFVASPAFSEAALRLGERAPGPLGRVFSRLGPKLSLALAGLRTLTTPSALVWPTLLSIVAWSLEGLGLYVILRGFGKELAPHFVGFCYATATLAGAVVPVPGGLGVTEKILDEQLVHLGGAEPAVATAAMLLIRFATLWYAVGVGFGALGLLRVFCGLGRPGELGAEVAPPSAAPEGGAPRAAAP